MKPRAAQTVDDLARAQARAHAVAAGPDAVAGLVEDLGGLLGRHAVSVEARNRRVASTDWAHMSPILSARLPAGLADVVAYPADAASIAAAVAAAHRRRVPVTLRGQGTGNYGQSIPLAGGLVIDTSRGTRVLAVGDGRLTAEAGASFVTMEAVARRHRQELAIMPSTVGSTVGGFIAGGAGGTGSIENGAIWDGYVRALELAPCTDEARPVEVVGDDTGPAIHAYGTTGMILTATVALRPARDWVALLASFPRFGAAAEVGQALMALDPPPRLVSVDEPALAALLARDEAIPGGRACARSRRRAPSPKRGVSSTAAAAGSTRCARGAPGT
jgi:FAD/FMN-containing dehydrogenase